MIKRRIFDEIQNHLKEDEITLLVGPRQVGKTTILRQLQNNLDKNTVNIISYDLDLETDFALFKKQSGLINHIKAKISDKKKNYVFIDEIQRKKNAGLFLKGIYDLRLPIKFVITGSGSLELKEKIHESLAGRKRIFEVTPVSFEEFLQYKWGVIEPEKVFALAAIEKDNVSQYFLEYINYGGYPKIVVQNNVSDKVNTLNEIFNSFLIRDISIILKIGDTNTIFTLLQVLSDRIGQKIQYNNIASLCGISVSILKKYLWYLEKMFIIKRVSGFATNKTKEISKAPVYYFVDLGLRNYVINMAGNIRLNSAGFVFENFVLHQLLEKTKGTTVQIKFWQTKDKAEVDFVIDKFHERIPVEVKFQRLTNTNIPRSLANFIKKYEPNEAWIVNLELDETIKIGTSEIRFIPFYKLPEKGI